MSDESEKFWSLTQFWHFETRDVEKKERIVKLAK